MPKDSILDRARHFLRSESGTTAIEYGLIVSLVFLIIVTAVNALATSIQTNLYAAISAL